MRTSRTHTAEVESRNEKRKRKREKQLSPDNRVEVNEVNNISDASETDNNRKKHVPSFCNLEACEPVLTQTSEQQSALLDKILQLEDNFTAQNMENHTTINTKRKKLKRGNKRNTGENSFHDQRPVETSPYSLPEDVQSNSSLDIVKVDSLRNNKEAPTNDCVLPLAPVASEDSGLKKSELVPENSSNSHEVKNDGLICAKKAKQKGKSISFNMEKVQDYVPSPLTNVAQEGICAESSTLMKCVQLDSVEKNTSGASTSNNLTSLVNKEEISLTNGIETGSTKKVGMSSEIKSMNHGESRKTKKKAKTKKGKGQNDTSESSSLTDITEKEPPRDNMISAVNKEENVDMEGRILEKNAEADLPKENEVTNICSIQTGISKEKRKGNCSDGVIKPLQGDVANRSVKTPISKKGRNKKKKLKHATPEERSSMNETVEMNYGLLDELPKATKNCVVSVEENLDGSSTYSEVSLPHSSAQGTIDVTEKESPRDNMISAVNKEENVDMEGRISEKDAEADLPKENEVTNICSIQTGISKEKRKGNCSDGVIKPLQGDVENSSVKTPVSKKRKKKKKKSKHATPEERSSMNETVEMNCGLLDELPKATKNCVVSVEENLDGSSTYSEVSLPHYSGQGTTDATPLTNKEDSSFKGEKASFSYQVIGNTVKNELYVDHSEKAPKSNKRDKRKNEKPSHSVDNALHDNNTFTPSSEQLEQKNEDFNELQRHNILSKEKISTGSRKVKKVCSPSFDVVADEVALDVIDKCEKLDKAPLSPERAILTCTRKKLLVLDLNGLLVDVIYDSCNAHKAPIKVGGKSVFKRPFCDEFLEFCFDVFDVGVWSSRRKKNVSDVVDFLMRDLKHKLLFCWDQSKCTITGFNTIENVHKPLVLKELKKLWNKEELDLPWEKGQYSPSNTLLVDDSPYKALCNPPYTAIFPHPYNFQNEDDKSLGPAGDIRVYLEGLAMVDDVQNYVRENPFGQRAITSSNPSWKFYLRVIDTTQSYSVPTC